MRAAASTLGRLPRAVAVVPRAAVALPRVALGLPRTLVRAPAALVPGRHGRRRLIALAVLLSALGALYMFWLRDSSLVRVTHVTVTGLDRADSARVQRELAAAAGGMTTLHVNETALRRAVANESVVRSISVQTDFPHGLRITIVQNRPVALLVAPGRAMAVAPDGTLLDGTRVSSGLPAVHVASLPSHRLPDSSATLQRVYVAAAAPARLLARVQSISTQPGRGVVAQLLNGPVVIFGQAVDLQAKWAAAAAVLAQHSSAGATYIDVRMPDRPVAGGLGMQDSPQPQPQAASPGAPGVVPAIPPVPAGSATPSTGAPTQVLPAAAQSPAAAAQAAPAQVTPQTAAPAAAGQGVGP